MSAPRTSDDPRMVKGPDGVPVHLLWDDCSPILTDGVKTQKKSKKKAGWGLKYAAEEGASDDARGLSSITLTQLQKSIDMQQQRGAGAESMDVDDKTDPPQDEDDCVLLRGGPRRHNPLVVHEDDE